MTFTPAKSPFEWVVSFLIFGAVIAFEYWFITRRLRRAGRSWPMAIGITLLTVIFFALVYAQH